MALAIPQCSWSHWVELIYCLWSKFCLWAQSEFSTILHNLSFPPRWCHAKNSALFIFYLPIFLTTNLKHSRSSGYFLLIRNTVYSCMQIVLFVCHRGGGNWRAKIPTSNSQNLGTAMANFQVWCFPCREPKLHQLTLVLTPTEAVKVWSWFCLVFVIYFVSLFLFLL